MVEITVSILVADIYDKLNCLFFHNKKSGQTILGSLILKNKAKCDNYFEELNKKGIDYTQINTENFCWNYSNDKNNKL